MFIIKVEDEDPKRLPSSDLPVGTMSEQGVTLESWRITPERRTRGVDVAWEEAIENLRKVYDAQLARFGGARAPITLTVSIARHR
jgi:hypothetical protein